jgi:hypothetical protein
VDLRGTFGLALWAEPDFHDTVPNFRWPNAVDPNPLASDPATFQLCYLEVDAPSAGDTRLNTGVSLAENKIGTTGVSVVSPTGGTLASPQAINAHAGVPNNFFATPTNENPSSGVLANAIDARFRLGNFGSTPAMLTGAGWKTLGNRNVHPAIAANGGEQTINFTWTPTAADEAFYNTPAHFHQCILVELSSSDPSITFLNESAARNMDFGFASKFTREVEVSVAGLRDGYRLPDRDVYISVERINMPVKMDDETRKKYEQVRETLRAVTNVEGDFQPESRYVSIVRGDMRHLRFIDFAHFVAWLRDRLSKRELVVQDSIFELLRKLDVSAVNTIELIDRYFDQVRDGLTRLIYNRNGQPEFSQRTRQIVDVLVSNTAYVGPTTPAVHPLPPMEDLQRYMPTVRYHVYHDTGRISTLNGVNRPVLETQPSFGYYLWLDHDVQSWELRLHGAQKLRENFYLIRPPTEGSTRITTSIHAVQQGEENQIEPPEKIVPFPQYPRKDTRSGCRLLLKKLLRLGG